MPNYWKFTDPTRSDVLVEDTDRDPRDPVPDTLTVRFWSPPDCENPNTVEILVSKSMVVPTDAPRT